MYELYWIDELGYKHIQQHFNALKDVLKCIEDADKKCKKKYRKNWILYKVVREKIDLD